MYYLGDFSKQKKPKDPLLQPKKEEKKKRDWNNWEKAREIRSGLSTGQRVSQDVRGWLAFANNAKRMAGI